MATEETIPAVGELGRASDQKYCHACAKVLHASAIMCPNCGAQQQAVVPAVVSQPAGQPYHTAIPGSGTPQRTTADQRHCHGCGNIIHAAAPICPRCGAPQPRTEATGSTALRSRVTAILLAFFLGGFGAHKFYCGKTGLGFLYLVFFWTWIPAMVALVEGILYITSTTTDQEFTGRYCI